MFSTSRTQVISTFIFLSVFFGYSVAAPHVTFGVRQDQIKEIESKLSREKQKLKAFDSQERDILAILSRLEKDVAEKKHAMEESGKKIRLLRAEIETLKGDLAGLERSLHKTRTLMASRLVALYKYARKGYFKILANAGDLDQFRQRTIYLKAIMAEDREMLEGLAEEERKYRKRVSKIGARIASREAAKKDQEIQVVSLRRDLEKKVIRLMKIHKGKEFYETAVKELELAAQDVKKTLKKIEKKVAYKVIGGSGFADSRGKLPFPLRGKVVRGDKLAGSGRLKRQKGIFISDSSSIEVRAIYPGRVDFSGRLKGYGEVIIINHSSRFFTISAQLSRRKKREGDVVEEGEAVGLVGKTSSRGAGLYFEIRKGGKILDPLKWLKVR